MSNNGVHEKQWPRTLEEAVKRILSELSEQDKETIKNEPHQEQMMTYHDGLGRWVRNEFGLWKGNHELLRGFHPDTVSTIILFALWEELHRKRDVSDEKTFKKSDKGSDLPPTVVPPTELV